MGPINEDRGSQPEPTVTRESLVDLDVPPTPPNGWPAGSRPRRKRVSDLETDGNETPPPPQTKPQYRPSLAAGQTKGAEPPCDGPAQSKSLRPRLVTALSSEDVPGLLNLLDPPPSAGNGPTSGQPGVGQLTAGLCAKPNVSLALIAGLAAAVVGAMIWALLAMATSYDVGWMAMGVGLLAGGVIRVLGRGVGRSFGCLGAAATVFGCLLGNFLSVCTMVASQESLPVLSVLMHLCAKPAVIPVAMIATFHTMDPLFYGIAVYVGYRLSFHRAAHAEGNGGTCLN